MTRRHRIVAALLAALALNFAQLAVAAHACGVTGPPAAVQMAPDHECCNEDFGGDGGIARDVLCVGHCHPGDASVDGGQRVIAIAVACPALRVDYPERSVMAAAGVAGDLVSPAAFPRVTIFYGVLRI